ncbi:MAG TPA: hypothetical protein VNH11_33455 [Pirellulales bacterium]|nr:hypothetical protein [Pirellulales bacterium]
MALGLLLMGCSVASAWQAADKNDDEQAAAAAPQLRLEAGGPTAFVTSLVFSPASDTLLIGGWDKLVDVWRAAPQGDRRWQRDAAGAFRIPIGPETWGAINAVAISPDGEQLAVGGKALARGVGDWQHPGWLVPTLGLVEEGLDRGTIYVFDVRTRQVRQLRGHRGVIWALAYVSPGRDRPRCLVSAAAEPGPADSSKSWMVVRVWNADDGRHLAAGSITPWPRDAWSRPAVTAWSFGDGPKEIAVAVATGEPHTPAQGESASPGKRDYQCCLFNAQTGRRYYAADGTYNRTLVYSPARRQLIGGSTNKLTIWDVPPRADGPPRHKSELRLGTQSGQFRGVVPLAMSLVPPQPDPKRLALVLRHVFQVGKDRVEDDRLQLVDLATLQKVGKASFLWREGKTPALAVSRDGEQLAVTGGKDHRVRIYRASDLGAEQAAVRQTIGGEGTRFVDAAFVRNGRRLGLLLIRSKEPKPRGRLPRQPIAGDLVFDADRGEVTGEVEGWQTLVPDGGWSVEEGQAKHGPSGALRQYLRVRRQGQVFGERIWLPPLDELSDYAVLPPGGDRQVPLLAVATHELGEPSLYLYDARNGQRFRRLSGHIERLRSLAFHPEAAMLVSTSDDETVCVWSLLDWQECLGKRGWLSGLAVERRGGRLAVARNATGEPIAGGRLLPGDTLDAVVEVDGRQVLTRPHDLYSAILRRKPGETVTLISSRGGAAARPVAVELGQATDQRMPLFSLFCVQKRVQKEDAPDAPGDFDWLGWSPSGTYDASSPEIESRIGWHFNTGRAEAPVRYALAAEYARLRRADLLPQLLHHPDQAPAPPEQPPPKLSVWIEPNDPNHDLPDSEDEGDLVQAADGEVTLRASLADLDPGLIRSVGWREPGGELHAMQAVESSSQEYAADLSPQRWRRGRREIECVVATNDVQRPRISRSIVLSFLPPSPPTITIVAPEASQSVAEEKRLRFRAAVKDARHAAATKVALVHLVDGQEKQRWQWTGAASVDQSLDLQPGENRLRLTAVASDAPPAEADRETAVAEHKLYYQPQAPQLGLEAVVKDESRLLGKKNNATWDVEEGAIVVRGTITAADELAAAEWKWGGDEDWHPFHGFERGKELRVDEKIALEPGQRRLLCRATTVGRRPSREEVSLAIDYRPPLPRLGRVGLAPRQVRQGAGPLEVVLSGEWEAGERLRPFTLQVFRDDQPLASRVEIDEAQRTFRVRAPVSPTDGNRLQIRVANEWRTELVDAPSVDVLRPPSIVAVEAPAQSRQASVDLRFTVESPNDRPLREIKVGLWPLPLESGVPDRGPDLTRWQVVAKNVPLQLGRNLLAIAARNDDGWTVRPAEAVVELLAPPPPPPEITIDSPAPGQTFAVPRCEVAFSVTSSSRLSRVALLRNGHHIADLDVERQAADGDGGFRMEQHVKVELPSSGPNVLSLMATNEGGSQQKEMTVAYLPPPVEVLIDRIETPEPEGKVLAAEQKDDGYQFAKPLSRGDVWLYGRVRWTDVAQVGAYPVAVTINGYSQLPASLGAAGDNPRERAWKAQLWLDRKSNRVEVSLLDLVRDRGSRLSFEVRCDAPLEKRRLHMLVIGIGDVDGERLERDALAAVHGTPSEKGGATDSLTRFTTPAFAFGELRRPRIREIDPAGLTGRVMTMLREIRRKHAGEPGTDLFILYYRGLEAVEEGGRFYLQTSLSNDLQASLSGVSGDELEQMFERSLGAHLCLLDVKRSRRRGPPSMAPTNALSSPQHTGVLRSAWLRADDRPDDAWLLVWFREAVTGRSRLGDLRTAIDKVYQDYQGRFPGGLELDSRIPQTLDDVVLSEP